MNKETKFRTCNLCEALCGLEIQVENNQVLSIKGDKLDVFSKGHICPKAVALKDIHEDPDRLKKPIQKVNGEWQEIAWDQAFKLVAKSVIDIQEKRGDTAVGIYQGNPSAHNIGTTLFSPQFVRSLKTTNRYSATSVDQLAHHLAGEYMFGNQFLVPVPDICRTDYWLILGGNPMVSNGSLMTAPDVAGKLKDIQKRGGKVVLIDPRRTETARKADQHLFINPGTDLWFLLALIHEVFRLEKQNLAHLESIIDQSQVEEIEAITKDFTPEKASKISGIRVEDIKQVAQEFISSKSAVCYGRLGVSAAQHGGLCHWAINTLNIITGNFDQPGGAMFSSPAIDVAAKKSKSKRFGRWQSRVRKLPEFGGELPATTMAEDILEPGEGQIKAMFTSCGNPVLSVPNGTKIDEAFDSLDFMCSIDIYLNETTRHADVILPPATGLETPHYGLPFYNLAVHNTAKFSQAAVKKDEDTKYDWEIFSELKIAIEKERANRKNQEYKEDQLMTLEERLDMMLQFGPRKMSLHQLKENPHGIDLGPLKSNIGERIQNDNGRIEIFPDIYKEALQNLPSPEENENALMLIGRRHLRSNNSWLHNSYRMVKGNEKCTALINPIDAKKHGVVDGTKIKVKSRVGEVSITAEISDEINIGTLSIPHGWGHHRKGTKMKIAEAHAGVSMNDLVDDELVDALSGVAVINGVPVTIEKV